MNKKTLIIIIAAVLVVVIAAVGAYFAVPSLRGDDNNSSSGVSSTTNSQQDVQDGNIELGEVEVLADGEFKVEVKVANNPGFAGYDLEFGFDAKSFSFVKCENGLLSPMTVTEVSDGAVAVVGVENGDVTDNGTMFTLVFKANKDAKKGKYEIKTTKSEFANWDEQTVNLKVAVGTITVK